MSSPVASTISQKLSATTTKSSGLPFYSYPNNLGGYDCYPVAYEVHEKAPYVDPLWLGLAILFGLLIGAILALLIFRFCFRRWWERIKDFFKEFEDDRRALMEEHKNAPARRCCALLCLPFWYMTKAAKLHEKQPIITTETKVPLTEIVARPNSSYSVVRPNSSMIRDQAETRQDFGKGGMVDIALQDTMEQSEAELNYQDVVASDEIENDILEKRKQISEKLAQIHMNQKSDGTKADREAIEKALIEFRAKMTQTQSDMEIDLKAQLETLKTDPEYANNEQKLNEAIQSMRAAHRRRLHVIFKDHLNTLRDSLRKNTKMSETDIDDLMTKLRSSLADLENHLANVIQLQADQLEDNLAQRQYLLEQLKINDEDLDKEQKHTTDAAQKVLQQLIEQSKLGETAKEKLLDDLALALSTVREKHRAAVRLQLDQIGSKLRKQRNERLEKLKQQHNEQLNKLMSQAETMTDTAQFLQAIRELLDQQADEKAEVGADLDKDEAGKLRQAHARVEQSWKEALQHETEQFINEIQEAANLSPADVRNLIRDHELDLREWEKMRDTEKKVALSELRTKLDERKSTTTRANAKKDSEQRQLTKRQDDMIQRVLEAQRDLEDGDRRQILVEHAHNQDVLSSMLVLTKLRQERILAQTLAQRKLKIDLEKKEKLAAAERKRARRSSRKPSDGQTTKDEDTEMAATAAELEVEKERLLQELRDATAVETKALMGQQETNMAALIGRLQVGQARRQIALERQDHIVKKMEHELKQQVQNLPPPDPNRLDELLDEHRRQVDHLNKALDDTRQRQLQMLRERLEEKRLKTKKNLEARFEAEEEEILTRSLKSKMSFASTLLCQNKLTARHQRALEQLELQTKSEMERQKEQLNKQMQKELERTLLEQKKQFLGQLATVCKMTPEEIKAMSRAAQESHKQQHPRPTVEATTATILQAAPAANNPSSHTSQPEGGRLPPIERMGFRSVPSGGNEINGEATTPKKRRKKKSKRVKPVAHDDSDSV